MRAKKATAIITPTALTIRFDRNDGTRPILSKNSGVAASVDHFRKPLAQVAGCHLWAERQGRCRTNLAFGKSRQPPPASGNAKAT